MGQKTEEIKHRFRKQSKTFMKPKGMDLKNSYVPINRFGSVKIELTSYLQFL